MATTTKDGGGASRAGVRARQTSLIREAIFGLNDGLVATVGLVSGEVLSHQSHGAVLVAALSATGAATVSMAIGSYLASASEIDLHRKLIADQAREIHQDPSAEAKEVRDLLRELGVGEERVRPVSLDITRDRGRWLRFMIREQLGLHEAGRENPVHNAFTMAGAVVVGSLPPVVPFLLPLGSLTARNLAWGLSLVAAFSLGFAKGTVTQSAPWRSGLQFAVLASASAIVGAGIGLLLGSLGA
jgi:VIT1/CCC1 family predicted Fe2+/Mn2+ transporter